MTLQMWEARGGQGGACVFEILSFPFSLSVYSPGQTYSYLPILGKPLPIFPNQREKMDKEAVSDWSRPRRRGGMDGMDVLGRESACRNKQIIRAPRDGTAKCLKRLWDTFLSHWACHFQTSIILFVSLIIRGVCSCRILPCALPRILITRRRRGWRRSWPRETAGV